MKINDKHLASFALGSSPVDKEGWLLKRGDLNKAFQKRWFVLKGNLLFYFEKRADKDPIGVIVLEGCTVELAESADAYTFELAFQGAGSRTYVIAAETQEEMESWMKAVTCAGYDYMRLMVSELQRQLDEVNINQNDFTSSWVVADPAEPNRSSTESEVVKRKSNAAVRHSKGQGMLVDLSVPDNSHSKAATPATQGQGRQNPFNNQDDDLDLFGATPFQAASSGPARARSFQEMHEQFGDYIQRKMRQHSQAQYT